MQTVTFEEFEARAHARGFNEVQVRVWDGGSTASSHTHAFSVEALVVAGEMWLTVGEVTRHLRPGDTFTLDREVQHAERYGPDGATYWAARRN